MSFKKMFTFLGWPLLVLPLLLCYVGSACNEIAVIKNGYQMPVVEPYCQINADDDPVHKCVDSSTKWKALVDIFPSDNGVSSIGDEVITLGEETTYPGVAIWALLGLYCWHRREVLFRIKWVEKQKRIES